MLQDTVRTVWIKASPVLSQRFFPGDINIQYGHLLDNLFTEMVEGLLEPAVLAASCKFDDCCLVLVVVWGVAPQLAVFQADPPDEHVPKILIIKVSLGI